MKDFVFAPETIFYSLKFIFQPTFFIGTKEALYLCPITPGATAQEAGRIYNLIEGKKSDIFLTNFLNDPSTNSKMIHELFASVIEKNNSEGSNNVAYLDLSTAKFLRFNASWIETSIAVGYKESFIGDKYMVGNFGKEYKKSIVDFYKQYYPSNKVLKAANNFK